MNSPIDIIRENWLRVVEEVALAAEAHARSLDEIQIVGVTKYVDTALTRALRDVGCTRLGENRPQSLWEKSSALADQRVEWHLIGHLQRNKVRRTVPLAALIHSVDSLRLAESISESAVELGRDVQILLEVNISGDASKHGLPPDQLMATLDAAANLANLRVRGLMAMAGLDSDMDEARRQFAALRQLRDYAVERGIPESASLGHLSMGMSNDFPLAIAEGATIVRIGSRLFAGCDKLHVG